MAINVLQFDRDNSQQGYQYIAKRSDTGEEVIGAVVVDRPHSASSKNYTYYVLTPYFNNDSLHSMRFSRFKVDEDTIRPYTQSEEVAYLLSQGQSVDLIEIIHDSSGSASEKTVASLLPNSKVPHGLWSKEDDNAPEIIVEDIKEEETEYQAEKSDETPVVEKASEPKKRGRKKKNP